MTRAALAELAGAIGECPQYGPPLAIDLWDRLAERGVLLVTEERINAIIREKGAEWWAAFEADGYDGVADVLWAALSGEVTE